MLKQRLIPKLQLKTRKFGATTRLVLVTTNQFNRVIEVGDPVSQAKIYQAQMADELILVDLDAGGNLRPEFVAVVEAMSEKIFMPLTVGGGVNSVEDFRILLANGADKISINTAAMNSDSLISQAADSYGSQCVVVSIDYRIEEEGIAVWTNGGRTKTMWHPVDWACEVEKRGAGEILLTSITQDGSCKGLDLELLKQVTQAVSIPVIVSGGCGLAKHFIEGFVEGNAQAVSAGTFFCFKDQNPMQTRAHIKNANIHIRLGV